MSMDRSILECLLSLERIQERFLQYELFPNHYVVHLIHVLDFDRATNEKTNKIQITFIMMLMSILPIHFSSRIIKDVVELPSE